ncbi:MAG: nucleotidyl transferase AbiEii/AbiGii toxin family protein [Acidobacteria bacterium]|nr:nucleotidyl transferase AbiEii/AbiGii toxin family protein [Acidobacteriota bacterium]
MIPQRNISLLANRLTKAGVRRIPESVLERDYCLAWFLAELAESELRRSLAFKGGTALKRCYFADYRFSEDMDFTLIEPMPFEDIRQRLESVYEAVREASGIEFTFDREDRQLHANSHTFYLRYVGPLPAGGSVKVDITIREKIVFALEGRPVLRAYAEFSDLPDGRVVQAYSLAETATEKVLALADRARNEPRDLYDLWHLVSCEGINLSELVPAMTAKLAFRQQEVAGIQEAIIKKEARLKALWSGRLSNQMAVLPPFDQVFRELRRVLRQANLP